MLIMNSPQFTTQNDDYTGDGIPPVPGWWQIEQTTDLANLCLCDGDVEPAIWNVFVRLYSIFQHAKSIPLTPTRLHDLTCFVIHRLLLSPPAVSETCTSILSDCVRCAIILYMLILQGPTYYTHISLLQNITARLALQLQKNAARPQPGVLDSWLVAIGLVASHGTSYHQLFRDKVRRLSKSLSFNTWEESFALMKSVLWLESPHIECIFQGYWDTALGDDCQLVTLNSTQIAASKTGSLGLTGACN